MIIAGIAKCYTEGEIIHNLIMGLKIIVQKECCEVLFCNFQLFGQFILKFKRHASLIKNFMLILQRNNHLCYFPIGICQYHQYYVLLQSLLIAK